MKTLKLRIACTILILLLSSITAVFGQAGNKAPVRYLDHLFSKVDVQKDIPFGESVSFEGQAEKLLLDIYAPAGDTETGRPVLLLFHGGGFRPGNDKSQDYIVRTATDFAKRGYVCVSLNYRVRNKPKDDPKGTISDALADAMAGLNWIRSGSQELKINPQKIFVGGGSAGGMLAVNFCFREAVGTEKWDKSGILGTISLWGGPDPVYKFFTVDKNDPPAILVHGTADKVVPYQYALNLAEELKSSQVRHELVTLQDAGHTPASQFNDFAGKIAAFLYALLPATN